LSINSNTDYNIVHCIHCAIGAIWPYTQKNIQEQKHVWHLLQNFVMFWKWELN